MRGVCPLTTIASSIRRWGLQRTSDGPCEDDVVVRIFLEVGGAFAAESCVEFAHESPPAAEFTGVAVTPGTAGGRSASLRMVDRYRRHTSMRLLRPPPGGRSPQLHSRTMSPLDEAGVRNRENVPTRRTQCQISHEVTLRTSPERGAPGHVGYCVKQAPVDPDTTLEMPSSQPSGSDTISGRPPSPFLSGKTK